ncbi:MAG: hypothetical protein ABIN57_09440 [Chitinophagaceae bacterium]
MKLTVRILHLFFFLSTFYWCGAQVVPQNIAKTNLRVKQLLISGDSILLDSLSIVPSTFTTNLPDSLYRLDYINAILFWKKKPETDSVFLSYRVFPYKLRAVAKGMNFDSIKNNLYLRPFEFENKGTTGSRLLDFGNLQYSGSFGRGISFGNNQDAVVNSNFQLQLNGMLRDSIEVAAALTDNNIPIQPDGTTQQLNEFDQVFLQFKKKGWQLNLGDIDIRQNDLYFLNFYKRLQGISFKSTNHLSKNVVSNSLISGSIAKGKFTRNIIKSLEGNQGPYRLQGANNEFFFIVLAGTERVYLDGELLRRGDDADYVINYNTAEVLFTPRRMITKDSRIQIEFEYADRNFINANIFLAQDITINNKLKLKVAAFNNSDAKNSSLNQSLDARQKQFLFNLGDSVSKAFYPTATLDTFSTGRILYQKIYDTTGNNLDSFYQYATDPALAKYSLAFTEVGKGRGNYIPDFNGANGKVFRYVAPIAGVRQGNYEPVLLLVTPKKQQLLSVGADYQWDSRNLIKTEFAVSKNDVNTFSKKDAGDDVGAAFRLLYTNMALLQKANGLQLTSAVDYEHVDQKFKPLERIRNVEFSREWGLPIVTEMATENIIRLSTQLQNKKGNNASYQFINYQRSDQYRGFQNILRQAATVRGWVFQNGVALTNFKSKNETGSFFRPVIDMSKLLRPLDSIRVGFRYALEKNRVRYHQNNLVTPTSFSFDTYTFYIRSNERKRNKYGINFFTRADKYPLKDQLIKGDRSYNVNLQAELLKSVHRQFILNTTFRKLHVYNTVLSKQKEDNTILGRAEYVMNEWKGFLTGNVLYEVGAGQEQKRDFAFIEVPAGQGQYTWIDYDSNGVQTLNEFEISAFQDQAKFVRILIPTNQYTKANYTTLNYSLTFNPKAVLPKTNLSSLGKVASLLNFQTAMQKSKKSVAKGDFEFNPFKHLLQDTSLITLNTSLLNTMSFNRYNSKWGFDVSNLQNTSKALLTYGYESRKVNDWSIKSRWNFSRSFTLDVVAKKGTNALYTATFANRNYELEIKNIEPRFIFTSGTKLRLQTGYQYNHKVNSKKYGGEESISNALNIESKYNVLQSSSINTRFTYNNIHFNKNVTNTYTPVSYLMLDGLLPGKNFLWSVDFTKKLLNNIELNLQYEGRKPGNSKTINVGRASVRALF